MAKKLVIKNIGMVLSGALEAPIIPDTDTIVAVDGRIRRAHVRILVLGRALHASYRAVVVRAALGAKDAHGGGGDGAEAERGAKERGEDRHGVHHGVQDLRAREWEGLRRRVRREGLRASEHGSGRAETCTVSSVVVFELLAVSGDTVTSRTVGVCVAVYRLLSHRANDWGDIAAYEGPSPCVDLETSL